MGVVVGVGMGIPMWGIVMGVIASIAM